LHQPIGDILIQPEMLSHLIQIPDIVLEGDSFALDRGGLPKAAWIVQDDAASFG